MNTTSETIQSNVIPAKALHGYDIPEMTAEFVFPGPEENTEEAILLLFLSDISTQKQNASQIAYYSDENEFYYGIQTNDAPVQYLLHSICKNKERLRRILCITTKSDITPLPGAPESAFSRFEKMIHCFIKEQDIEIVPVPYDYRAGAQNEIRSLTGGREIAAQLYTEMRKALAGLHAPNVYIDFTGGLRIANFLMVSLIRYMQFAGLKCSEIVYSEIQQDKQSGRLFDMTEQYGLFDIINGTADFISYGSARLLRGIYEKTDNAPLHKLLNALLQFSDAISLCRMNGIESTILDIKNCIQSFENEPDDGNNLYFSILKNLIPTIKNKMHFDEAGGMIKDGEVQYPVLIRWCMENRLMQQAITLYVEKLPGYYVRRHIFDGIENLDNTAEPSALMYILLFDYFLDPVFSYKRRYYVKMLTPVYESANKGKALNKLIKSTENEEDRKFLSQVRSFPEKNGSLFYGEKPYTVPKDIDTLLKILLEHTDSNPALFHYCIFNDDCRYKSMMGAFKKAKDKTAPDDGATYPKKIDGLKNTMLSYEKEGFEFREQDSLTQLLAFYLCVKLLRNRMNHAAEKEYNEFESAAAEELQSILLKKGISVRFSEKYDDVQNLMEKAMDAAENAKPVVFRKK